MPTKQTLKKTPSINTYAMGVFDTPIGPVSVQYDDHAIHRIDFGSKPQIPPSCKNTLSKKIGQQLRQYFKSACVFNALPIVLSGTDFQLRVWNYLKTIPLGQVRTYGQVADDLNSSPRAVGGAVRRNPCSLVIPCHRVVAANGLGGFSGQTDGPMLEIKTWLLEHEGLSLQKDSSRR